MATQRNLDVVSNKYTCFQSALIYITSSRIRFFFYSCHYYRTASASLNMYEFIKEDFFFHGEQFLVGQSLLIIQTSLTRSDTPQSVGLLWTSDQPDAETTT